jgi:hypothetical protein
VHPSLYWRKQSSLKGHGQRGRSLSSWSRPITAQRRLTGARSPSLVELTSLRSQSFRAQSGPGRGNLVRENAGGSWSEMKDAGGPLVWETTMMTAPARK